MPSAIPLVVGTAGAGFCCAGGWMLLEHCRRTEGENIPNVGGPSAEVMALSAVADTIAEYKRALATNDFKDEMSLDPRERALVIGTADHATLTYASPRRHLDAGSIGGRRAMSDGIFNLIAGPDRFISKEELLVYIKRGAVSKTDSGLTEAVIHALFAEADAEQDGTLSESELVTFLRLYKYYCYNYTCFAKDDFAFRDIVLQPLREQAHQSEHATPAEKNEDVDVEDATITIHRVEHLPAANEDGSLDATVAVFQRTFELNRVDATRYAAVDDTNVGKWSAAERKIGSTEARSAWRREQRWHQLGLLEALWAALGWPAQTVKFESSERNQFKCSAPGEVVLKLVDANWDNSQSDDVIGEARVKIKHPADLGGDGHRRMYRAALYHPPGSKEMIKAYMEAPPWDGADFPFYGPEYAGWKGAKVLGADGFPTVIVFSVDDWDERDRSLLRAKRGRRRRR